MSRFDITSLFRRRWFVGLVTSALTAAALAFAGLVTGDKALLEASKVDADAALELAAAALVCEVKLARGEAVDCDTLVATQVPAPSLPAQQLIPATPPIEVATLDVNLLAQKDARISVLEEQLGLERTARVDAESRADRLREALTAASEQTDSAVNDALNQLTMEMENERATQICFSRAQWDADRRDLASLCSAHGQP